MNDIRKARDSLLTLWAFADGTDDPETVAKTREGIRCFFENDGELSLNECFDLPNTPIKTRLAVRDHWLREASRLLGGANGRQRARRLDRKIRSMRRKIDRWFRADDVPMENMIEYAIFLAVQASNGKELPDMRQLTRVLESDSHFSDTESA